MAPVTIRNAMRVCCRPMADDPSSTHGTGDAPPAPVSLVAALAWWFRLGWVSFGGPAGQIALMHQELVERRRWISERRFLHAMNYCMLLPGPEAQQLATYVGWLMHGVRGGIAAGALFVLPSLLVLILLSWAYLAYGDTALVSGILYGVKPAVTALVLFAAWRIGTRTLRHPLLWAVAAAAFAAQFVFQVPFPAIILGAALAGLAGMRWVPRAFPALHAAPAVPGGAAPALIDDHTPVPAHGRFTAARLARTLAAGLALWGVSLGLLMLAGKPLLVAMGLFFTKAALLTFGGAYAVLPYVYQGAVATHGWLGATQMIDGLALGETTPGPLIMVVAFVGFLGGWNGQLLGADQLVLSGVVAAAVVTWFTFLPSFVFIFCGAPLVEATRHMPRLGAPLAAISAAVVGVILNLALFFAWHTLWPQARAEAPFFWGMDWRALLLGIGAFLLLWRLRLDSALVILLCAVAGLVLRGMGGV